VRVLLPLPAEVLDEPGVVAVGVGKELVSVTPYIDNDDKNRWKGVKKLRETYDSSTQHFLP
jgi:hypothetical protein